MTDKEIIIDGVDVGECSNYDPEQYFECEISSCHCEEITNCYFKQLKSKERECEKLKQWKEDAENLFKTQTDNADKIINRYKQALDEIEKLLSKSTSFTFEELTKTQEEFIDDFWNKVEEMIVKIQDIIHKAKEK